MVVNIPRKQILCHKNCPESDQAALKINFVRKLIVYEQFKELNIFNRLFDRIQNTDGATHINLDF